MDIKQIVYFTEVANHQNFSTAAKKLGVTQPALSAAIKKLETEFGSNLFSYENKQLKLTDVGRDFLTLSHKLINDYDALVLSMEELTAQQIGKIKVGVPLMVGRYFGKVFSDFKNSFPKIEIQVVEDTSMALATYVSNGDIDCSFVISPVSLAQFDIHDEVKDNYVLAVSTLNPLSKKDYVDFSDLKKETFVCFNDQFSATRRLMSNCDKAGFYPKIMVYSSQWDFMMTLVDSNQAVCMLPRPIVNAYHLSTIKGLPINEGDDDYTVSLITKKGRYLSKTTRLFIQHVKSFNQH
ncbi:MAG: LysR family transcriptional regulator [Bacilli bacterium]|nr:LysR family transcriptional regulator [Bacilli bacterium]MDD4066125.1 LysR family transcriptional regulator [Bacilli bacterium]